MSGFLLLRQFTYENCLKVKFQKGQEQKKYRKKRPEEDLKKKSAGGGLMLSAHLYRAVGGGLVCAQLGLVVRTEARDAQHFCRLQEGGQLFRRYGHLSPGNYSKNYIFFL